MGAFDDLTLGGHLAGDSFLHRLDPRLKLGGFPLLVIAAFSGGGLRLAVLGLFALLLLPLGRIPRHRWWRGIRALRWLLLFTILIHLFLSPGRTLLGQPWLSRDGLEHGLLVAGQLALAVTFSSLLTLTTAPREIAAALAALLAPLHRLRVPVREMVLLFLLVLRFIPILREEAAAELAFARGAGRDPGQGSLPERARALGQMMAPLLVRVIDRADGLAHAAAAGEDVWGEEDLPRLQPRRADGLALAGGLFGLSLLFCLVP